GPRPLEARPGVEARSRPSLLLSVKPGLTGPWRLVAAEDAVSTADAFYVRNYTIWADLQILYQTGRRLLAEAVGTGARSAGAPVRRWRLSQPLVRREAEPAISTDPPRGPQPARP